MPKIMEIIAKETNGKSYHTYKYSYDSIGVPSIYPIIFFIILRIDQRSYICA